MKSFPAKSPARPRSVGAGFLLAGLAAIAVGLLIPLLIGSFSGRELLIVIPIEAACLLAVVIGGLLLARRLKASHGDLWALSRRDELTGFAIFPAEGRTADELLRFADHDLFGTKRVGRP